MKEKRRLVMATNNAGKLREARAIAGDKLEILSLNDIGFHQDIPETADTLEGNALIKVRAIKEVCDFDVFADDTGLHVDALGGAPGVYSARYAGADCNPDRNIDLLLKNMEGEENRKARFRTCIALSLGGEEHLFEGSVEGEIATRRSGNNGFGYDPIFISEETGKCFAEMGEEEKNAISHRGRALKAMMKWLGVLSMFLITAIPAVAGSSAEWNIFNSFEDKIEQVFDTPDKTYYLVDAQLYDPASVDNQEKLHFLFCLEKESDETRAYNSQNYLSQSLIRTASYNALKKYLLIVYDNLLIDILYDDGTVYPIHALKNYDTSTSKEVRSISFDPERNLAYLATDFGYLALNDDKHEVASSGVYNEPIDRVLRVGDNFLILREGIIYRDDATSNHATLSDFTPTDWTDGLPVMNFVGLSSSKCVVSKMLDGLENHYILTFESGTVNPTVEHIGSIQGASFAENKDGLLLTRTSQLVGLDRHTGARTILKRDDEDYGVSAGSWDMKEVFYASPREGFYSKRLSSDGGWTLTRRASLPNAPAPFRSNFIGYSPRYGMMVLSHGIDQNFTYHNANNPLLLSAYRDGEWTQHGVPGFDNTQRSRLTNPCGFAQDPDQPDIFYFGSFLNGMMRYDITDFTSLLHFTRSDDSPSLPGHVNAGAPHSNWSNSYAMLYPVFDKSGNLILTHLNTDSPDPKRYTAELWIWTPEKRKATTSAETYQPFKKLTIDGINPNKIFFALPMETASARNLVNVFVAGKYDSPFVVYDHNGTPDDENDDRQAVVKTLTDRDGTISYHYIYCATEDPTTGLVWVGTDNGVFTFDPREQFSAPGQAQRILVSRNDGTSLADYLLDGITVNDITIDGRGRKWFSLNGGGMVCTSSDGTMILEEITSDDTMLPSDIVYTAGYNPTDNSLLIGTKDGLAQYYLSGNRPEGTTSEVRVYPNPVRPDYYGWVTIDGLEDDCLVKITDSAGNIVRELGPAGGGRVQWDVCNTRLDRVASGVYFVLASSGRDGGSYSEVSKILVIKQ